MIPIGKQDRNTARELSKLIDTYLSLSLASLFLWNFMLYFTLNLVLNDNDDTRSPEKKLVWCEVPAGFIFA